MSLLIKEAKFTKSVASFSAANAETLPEIAMAGKSNVGKSSLINSLTNNNRLARTSSEPGKTRLINFYRINGAFNLVDLPGYGFAKASKQEKGKWGDMIEGYLKGSEQLRHVFQLVDIRHDPTSDDVLMTEYLRHYEIPFTVIATKCDKLSKAAQGRSIPVICRMLVVQPWEIIKYSSETKQGRDELLAKIEEILK